MAYHYKPYKATPNANHMKRGGLAPLPHECKCRVCGVTYQGFGVLCPPHAAAVLHEQQVTAAIQNAEVETRIQNAAKPRKEMEEE